jgi:translation initiation factor 1
MPYRCYGRAVPEGRLVYSTDDGDLRRRGPHAPLPEPRADGAVRVSREKVGRRGKTVTVVRGLAAGDAARVAAELKKRCGAGGAVKDGAIEIQGDHRATVAAHLQAAGHRVKLFGG